MTPALSFDYSSRGGNGWLGEGWSIGGLSRITRCGKTWIQDGAPRSVGLTYDDRYCLDGNRLRTVSGAHGNNGSEYRTENETFSRVRSYGIAGNGPEHFVAETKDGLIYEYGNTADSRIESLGVATVRAWAVNKIRDRSGNSITFEYTEDTVNGAYRIAKVLYTSNSSPYVPPLYSIEFAHATQPAGEIDTAYFGSRRVDDITRMTQVDIKYADNLVRRYVIVYESSVSSAGKSRVHSIQECAGASGTDCLPATTFTYQNGTVGLANEIVTNVTIPVADVMPMDVNGDGKTDLVYSSSDISGGGTWMVMMANGTGYNPPASSGLSNLNFTQAIPIDYNADGLSDFMVPDSSGNWSVVLGTPAGISATPISTGIAATGAGSNAWAMDVNGDGLDDLVYAIVTGSQHSVQARIRVWGGTFAAPQYLYGPVSAPFSIVSPVFPKTRFAAGRERNPDFNGDGIGDFIIHVREADGEPGVYYDTWEAVLGGGNGVSYIGSFAAGIGPYWADVNGDGCSDAVYSGFDQWGTGLWRYRLSNCVSLGPEYTSTYVSSGMNHSNYGVLDWDGDGFEDLVGHNPSTQTWHLLKSTGQYVNPPTDTYVPNSASSAGVTYVGDINGDGLTDLLYRTASNTWAVRPRAGVRADLLKTVTDGYGNVTTFNYSSIAQGSYTKYATATYPTQEYQGARYVVSSLQASNGIGGSYQLTYTYKGARLDRQGRGFLGYAVRSWTDSRDSTGRHQEYRQDHPFIGAVKKSETKLADGTVISSAETTWSKHDYGTGYESRAFAYVGETVQSQHNVGAPPYNGAKVSTSTTTNLVDSTTGTVYDQTIVTSEPSAGANGLNGGTTWTTHVQRPPGELVNDVTNWCIGRPQRTTVSQSHSLAGGGAQTRTITSNWNAFYCRLTDVVVEPNHATLKVTTTLQYDLFGNLTTETVTGVGMPARTTTMQYDAQGQFPLSIQNALNQTTHRTWEGKYGTPATETDPNGISVEWSYDNLGRLTEERRPDGTKTTWSRAACNSPTYCGVGTLRVETTLSEYDSAGAVVRRELRYTDRFDRLTHDYVQGLGGLWSRSYRVFDALGRVEREYFPYQDNATSYPSSSIVYDLLGRPTQVSRPVSDTDSTIQTTYVYYEGLTTRTVDPLSKVSATVANAAGQVVRSTDHSGYSQNFHFDGFGNPVLVTDSLGNTLQSAVFNIRGMRTQSSDMDMGTWIYVPNALGEITRQTDAKGQITDFQYDLLGRLTQRAEPAGVSTWVWGASSTARNIGQLQSISGLGYSENNTFDSIGRLASRIINADASYQIDYGYNSFGALDTLTYPVSTGGYRLKLQYEYSAGALSRIRDFNSPGTIYWTANTANARGQVTQETLGNGLVARRSFDAVNGWIRSIQTGPGGGASIQNLAYQWDRVGNLTERRDLNQSLTESFVYDNLHRLDYSQLNGSTNLDLGYDSMGNISFKSDVGNYSYHPTKKHAVASTSAPSDWSFEYDANGNMTTGRGQNITWTSFNLPASITLPGSGGGGGPTTEPVNWTNLNTVTLGPNGAIQKSVGGNWNGTASSTQTITGDGSLEFKVNNNGASPYVNASWNCLNSGSTSLLEYCLNIGGGYAEARVNGVWQSDTTASTADTWKIAVESNVVRFYKNGTVFHTATPAPSFPLDAQFASSNDGYGLTEASITTGAGGGGGGSTNLALNKPASGSAACQASESWEKAVNGSVGGGWSDKWCSLVATKWLQVDLQSTQAISQFVVKHAQAGGEDAADNTRAFNIQVSTNGSAWSTVVDVPSNTQAVTTHPVTNVSARYIRLNIITPTQDSDPAARIYEFEAHGSAGGGGGSSTLSAQFEYDANHQYIKQIGCYADGCSTTYYIGGILEKVTRNGITQYRHMIRAGGSTAIVSRATNGTNAAHYVTQDHLGSSAAITDSTGAVLVNSSFGAFGARRGSNWTGTPSPPDWAAIASTTRRGYTDHTMLDNLSLIHMNGRVMDPLLGRFISADPYIDGAMNTQGWNRYSYVQNNPLSLVDPSGYRGRDCSNCNKANDPLHEVLNSGSFVDDLRQEHTEAWTRVARGHQFVGELQAVRDQQYDYFFFDFWISHGFHSGSPGVATWQRNAPDRRPSGNEPVPRQTIDTPEQSRMGGPQSLKAFGDRRVAQFQDYLADRNCGVPCGIAYASSAALYEGFAQSALEAFDELHAGNYGAAALSAAVTLAKPLRLLEKGKDLARSGVVRDHVTRNTRNWSAALKSEGDARALARQKLGSNPVEVEPGKWRSADGKWQYRAKPGDVSNRHIHLEELNPQTGEVLQNVHLRWPEGTGR